MKAAAIALAVILSSLAASAQTTTSPRPATATPAKHYQVIDLAPFPGASASQANAVSRGHAAGYSIVGPEPFGTPRATLWKDGAAEDLGNGVANAINSSDRIVGYVLQSDGLAHATLWDHGVVTDLGTLPGFDSALATGISDAGEIVGVAFTYANTAHESGFRWTAKTGMQAIPGAAYASGINAKGDIAGLGLNIHATIFSKKGTIDLGTLGTSFSIAIALNSRDHGVGYSPLISGSPVHGFFWDGKGLQDLGALTSGDSVIAVGINDADLVVGQDGNAVVGSRAFVWSRASGMIDLNGLISDPAWSLLYATGIDNAGNIVGAGVASEATHGFMLTRQKGVQ